MSTRDENEIVTEPIQTGTTNRPALNRPQSRASSRSRRSRPSSLSRAISGAHLDDHSYYNYHEHGSDFNSESDIEEKVPEENAGTVGRGRRAGESEESESTLDGEKVDEADEEIPENRDGILDERDLEAQPPRLEKRATTKSVRDPNIVSTIHFPRRGYRRVGVDNEIGFVGRSR